MSFNHLSPQNINFQPNARRSPLKTPFPCPNLHNHIHTYPSTHCPPAFAGTISSPWATRLKLLCPFCLRSFSRQLDPFLPQICLPTAQEGLK